MDYTDSGKFELVMEEDLKIPTPDELFEQTRIAMAQEVGEAVRHIIGEMKRISGEQPVQVDVSKFKDKVIQEVQKKLLDAGWSSKAYNSPRNENFLEIRPVSKR